MGDEQLKKFKDLMERGNYQLKLNLNIFNYFASISFVHQKNMSNFIAAHSVCTGYSRPEANEVLRALNGQHEKFDLQNVREQLKTPEMQRAVKEIQATVQLMETFRNRRAQNGSK